MKPLHAEFWLHGKTENLLLNRL